MKRGSHNKGNGRGSAGHGVIAKARAAAMSLPLAFGLASGLSVGLWLLPTSAARAEMPAYKVGSGDVLKVVAYGDNNLSGDFTVDENGAIGYPIIGSIPVRGMTPAEISDLLTQRLGEHVPGITATVTIASYAPVFALGDLTRPGSYPYRPGMIVVELVALSGGVPRLSATTDPTGLQFINSRQEYADLALTVFALTVRRARVEAERDGRDFAFALPADTDVTNRDARQRIIDAEKNVFDIRLRTLRNQQEALANQEKSYDQEIETLQRSIKLQSEEIRLLGQDVQSAKALVEKGLTSQSNYRQAERELSVVQRDALELALYLARANQAKLDIGLRRDQLVADRDNEAAKDLGDIDLQIARSQKRMEAILATIGELGAIAEGAADESVQNRTIYTVTRMVDGAYMEIAADERTEIRPGDILRATVRLADRRSKTAVTMPEPGAQTAPAASSNPNPALPLPPVPTPTPTPTGAIN